MTMTNNMFLREQQIHRNPKHLNKITPETHQHYESVRNGKETNSVYFKDYSQLAEASDMESEAVVRCVGQYKFSTLFILADDKVQRNV